MGIHRNLLITIFLRFKTESLLSNCKETKNVKNMKSKDLWPFFYMIYTFFLGYKFTRIHLINPFVLKIVMSVRKRFVCTKRIHVYRLQKLQNSHSTYKPKFNDFKKYNVCYWLTLWISSACGSWFYNWQQNILVVTTNESFQWDGSKWSEYSISLRRIPQADIKDSTRPVQVVGFTTYRNPSYPANT